MALSLRRTRKTCFHPPAVDAGAQGEEDIPWVLLEQLAYIADRRNDTTAYAHSRSGERLQVTFVAARPPRVSYICVFCPDAAAAGNQEDAIPSDPEVIASHDNLVLLRILVGPVGFCSRPDLYVYRPAPADEEGEGPSLTLLPQSPDIDFRAAQVGILNCSTGRRDGHALLTLRAHRAREDQRYMVAALYDDPDDLGRGNFLLYLYNSKLETWTKTIVSLDLQPLQDLVNNGLFLHVNHRVLGVGGDGGTMAFVDLWRGIILCDVLRVQTSPTLRFVRLPHAPTDPTTRYEYDALCSRDLVVVQHGAGGCYFRFARHLLKWTPCKYYDDHYIKDGWESDTWCLPVSATSRLEEDAWTPQCSMDTSKMHIHNKDARLLPKLKDRGGNPLPPFMMLESAQPRPSLVDEDDTVCFMVKVKISDREAWVVAVDMKENRLQAVAKFNTHGYVGNAYMPSTISKYLNKAPGAGAKGNPRRSGRKVKPGNERPKRPGWMLTGSSSKKMAGTVISWGGEQMQQDVEMKGTGVGAEVEDNMMLE
ncbi:hypothetical protein ACP4OV_031678 [Aristida adscensionis]